MIRCMVRLLLVIVVGVSSLSIGWAAPPTYTLGTPLGQPDAIAVDRYGRLLVADRGRQALMRFNLDGSLDNTWSDGQAAGKYSTNGRHGFWVTSDDKAWLGPIIGGGKTVRRIDLASGDFTDIPIPKIWDIRTAGADNGEYCVYTEVPELKASGGYTFDPHLHTFSPDGKLKDSWTCPRLADVAIGPDGCVYAGVFSKNTILVYSAKGKLLRTLDIPRLDTPFAYFEHLAIDRNGDIYTNNCGNIARISNDGKTARLIYKYDSQLAGSYSVPGIAVRNGLIYLLLSMNLDKTQSAGEIRTITPDGQCVARYVSPAIKLNLPGAIAVHPDGSYAVQQVSKLDVLLFHADDSPAGKIPDNFCGSVALGPDGGYYTADHYALRHYDSAGRKIKDVIRDAVVGDKARHITDSVAHVGRDPSTGNIWGVTFGYPANEVLVFGPDDNLIKRIHTSDVLWPGDIAVDPRGYLYVSCLWKNSVVKYDFDGKLVAEFGKQGGGIGELLHNNGIALDEQGRLYVADTDNSRVQVFSSSGEALGVWTGGSAGQLRRPMGVTIGPNKTLWVTDTYNDRIVRVPLADFWREVSKTVEPQRTAQVAAKIPAPTPGKTVVTAVVIAGTDDFTDAIYLESPDRAWGMTATLPPNTVLERGESCRLSGVLSASRLALAAESVERLGKTRVPPPLGMANLYVGDGYRSSEAKTDLSSLCLLVRTWGRVVSADAQRQLFVINDGSYGGSTGGLTVYAGYLRKPLAAMPKAGQYVAATGVSTTWVDAGGRHVPAVYVRDDADIQVLAEDSGSRGQ